MSGVVTCKILVTVFAWFTCQNYLQAEITATTSVASQQPSSQTMMLLQSVCNETVEQKSVGTQINVTEQCQETFETTCGFWPFSKRCTKKRFTYCTKSVTQWQTIINIVYECCPAWQKDKFGNCTIFKGLSAPTTVASINSTSENMSSGGSMQDVSTKPIIVVSSEGVSELSHETSLIKQIASYIGVNIVGIACGLVAALIIIITVVMLLCSIRKKRQRKRADSLLKRMSSQSSNSSPLKFRNSNHNDNIYSSVTGENDEIPTSQLVVSSLDCRSLSSNGTGMRSNHRNGSLKVNGNGETSDHLDEPSSIELLKNFNHFAEPPSVALPHDYVSASIQSDVYLHAIPMTNNNHLINDQPIKNQSVNDLEVSQMYLTPGRPTPDQQSSVRPSSDLQSPSVTEVNSEERRPRRFVRTLPVASMKLSTNTSLPLADETSNKQIHHRRGFSLDKFGSVFRKSSKKQQALKSAHRLSELEASGQYADLQEVNVSGRSSSAAVAQPYAVCAVVGSQSENSRQFGGNKIPQSPSLPPRSPRKPVSSSSSVHFPFTSRRNSSNKQSTNVNFNRLVNVNTDEEQPDDLQQLSLDDSQQLHNYLDMRIDVYSELNDYAGPNGTLSSFKDDGDKYEEIKLTDSVKHSENDDAYMCRTEGNIYASIDV